MQFFLEVKMAIKTIEEQLEEVQSAITALLSGVESYTIDGNTFRRSSLGDLQKREEYLRNKYSQSTGNKPRVAVTRFNGAFN